MVDEHGVDGNKRGGDFNMILPPQPRTGGGQFGVFDDSSSCAIDRSPLPAIPERNSSTLRQKKMSVSTDSSLSDSMCDHELETDDYYTDNHDVNNNSEKWCTTSSRRRKSSTPCRSAERGDPKFKGVTFQMRTFVRNDSSHLCMAAYFNCRKLWARASRVRQSVSSSAGSGGEDEAAVTNQESVKSRRFQNHWGSSVKQCASCGTRKTPLWRDAEDGTPLCNACGIRYKKYRIRCTHCWHIPRKETKAHANCANCGESLKIGMSVFKQKMM